MTRHLPVSSGLDLNAAFSRHFLAAEPVRDATLSDASKAGEIFLGHALIFEVSGYVHGRTLAPLLLAVNRGTHGRKSFIAGEIHEQWVYRRGPGEAQYVYLEDGVVTSFN